MLKSLKSKILSLLLVSLLLFTYAPQVEAKQKTYGWFGSDWNARKFIEITSTDALNAYQVAIKIIDGIGTDTVGTTNGYNYSQIYCAGGVQDDFGDIRFTTSNGITALPYDLMEYVTDDYGMFWLNLTFSAGVEKRVYVYWNTADTKTTTSNGNLVWDYFDDGEEIENWVYDVGTGIFEEVIFDGVTCYNLEGYIDNATTKKVRVHDDVVNGTGTWSLSGSDRIITRFNYYDLENDGYSYVRIGYNGFDEMGVGFTSFFHRRYWYNPDSTTEFDVMGSDDSGWQNYHIVTDDTHGLYFNDSVLEYNKTIVDNSWDEAGQISLYVNHFGHSVQMYFDYLRIGKSNWGTEPYLSATGDLETEAPQPYKDGIIYDADTWEAQYETLYVNESSDDCYRETDGGDIYFFTATNELRLTNEVYEYAVGIRFAGTPYHRYSETYHAYLELFLSEDTLLSPVQGESAYWDITIYGETGSADTYSTVADFEGRSLTTAYVNARLPKYTMGNVWKSPDLTPIINEIVDGAGFPQIGLSNLAFRILIVEGCDVSLRAYAFDHGFPEVAPKLKISGEPYGHLPLSPLMSGKEAGYWVGARYDFDTWTTPQQFSEPPWDQGWYYHPQGAWKAENWQGYYLPYIGASYIYNYVYDDGDGAGLWKSTSYPSYLRHRHLPASLIGDVWTRTMRKEFDFGLNIQDAMIYELYYTCTNNRVGIMRGQGGGIYNKAQAKGTARFRRYTDYITSALLLDGVNPSVPEWGQIDPNSSPYDYFSDSYIVWFHFATLDGVNLTQGFTLDEDNFDPIAFQGALPKPKYWDFGFNQSVQERPTRAFCNWTNGGLIPLQYVIYSTNTTGSWVNHTITSNAESVEYYGVYDFNPLNNGTIFYQWYANNTDGAWNSTGLQVAYFDLFGVSDAVLYNSDGTINNGWLFRNEYYDLNISAYNAHLLTVNFSDGHNLIEFRYENATNQMYIDTAGKFVIGEIFTQYNIVNASTGQTNFTWRFTLNTNIIDAYEVEPFYNMTHFGGFNLAESLNLTVHFYNLGGATDYQFSGDGRRVEGGREFDLQLTNGSNGIARASQIYRKLQHFHAKVEIDMGNVWDSGGEYFDIWDGKGSVEYGIDIMLNGSWQKIFGVRIYVEDHEVGTYNAGFDKSWLDLVIDWYYWNFTASGLRNFNTDYVTVYHHGYDHEDLGYTNRTSFVLFIDLWFDRLNSSTTIAGSVTPEYFGMWEQGNSFWFGYGAFRPIIDNRPAKALTDIINNDNGNVTLSYDIDLVRVWCDLWKQDYESSNNDTWFLTHTETNRLLAMDRMEGIDEPTLSETKVIDMPEQGFLAPLVKAINGIRDMIISALLKFIATLWGAMDSIFELAGLGDWWQAVKIYIEGFAGLVIGLLDYVNTSIQYVATLIGLMFSMVSVTIGRFFGFLTMFVNNLLLWYNQIIGMFTGGFGGIGDIWTNWGMDDWIYLFVTLSPLYWIDRIAGSNTPMETAKSDVQFFVWVLMTLMNLFIGVINLALNLIGMIIDLLPI